MNSLMTKHCVLPIVAAMLWCLVSSPVVAAAPENAGAFMSAQVCGSCHEAIYAAWKNSMHANATKDPIFYPIFLELSRATGGKSDALCLKCHAPTTLVTKDLSLENPLTTEGVTCDFCHSVRDVHLERANPFDLEPGKTQFGPLQNVSSPFHQSAYSAVFAKPEFCGGCHEYANERGVTILGTYSEWKKSPQAKEGKTCQTCHMPEITGLVVPASVKATKEIYINSHAATGGHSREQVGKAIRVKIDDARRSGDKIHAIVSLENIGSGHRVPTGLPTRKLVLDFRAVLNGTPIYSEKRVFQKRLSDEKGEVITKDADLFAGAYKVLDDNRLAPRQVRSEHFTFLAPPGQPVELEAEVLYIYQPQIIHEEEMKLSMGRETLLVP